MIREFFVQNKKEIGDFPNFDFFVNAKFKEPEFILKAEHFNSSLPVITSIRHQISLARFHDSLWIGLEFLQIIVL